MQISPEISVEPLDHMMFIIKFPERKTRTKHVYVGCSCYCGPFVLVSAASHDWFGWSTGVDGDLAFVGDWYNVYMFHQESNGKWVEFDMVDGYNGLVNSMSGDVIAVENY